MAGSDKQGGVSGIASAFEKSADDAKSAPSAVGGIAARFESAISEPDSGPSSKISSLASAFDPPAAAAKQSSPLPTCPVKARSVFRPEHPSAREKSETAASKSGDSSFNDAVTRFGAANADSPGKAAESGETPSMFKNAASAFEKREKDAERPVESKVSAFASQFDSSAAEATEPALVSSVASRFEKGSDDEAPTLGKVKSRVQEMVDASGTDEADKGRSGGVGAAAALFEKNRSEVDEKTKSGEADLPGRFKQATALFEGEAPAKTEDEQGESGSKRFADASKLFGGAE